MKMVQQLKVLLLLVTIVMFQACASNAPDNQETQGEGSQQEVQPKVALSEDCEPTQIPVEEARQMIDSAKVYIDAINTSGELGNISIPQGAKISDCMWEEIIRELGEKPLVWSMMAIDNGEMKIIFQGKSAEGEEYKYFNFVHPCPLNCPD